MGILYIYIGVENNKKVNTNYNTMWQELLRALYNHSLQTWGQQHCLLCGFIARASLPSLSATALDPDSLFSV